MGVPVIRKRSTWRSQGSYQILTSDGKTDIWSSKTLYSGTEDQVTISSNNQWYLIRKWSKNHGLDIGSGFDTVKDVYTGFGLPFVKKKGLQTVFTTQFARQASFAHASFPIAIGSSYSQLVALGTTAIARTAPVSPEFSLTNAIGELYRDGLPSIIGSGMFKTRFEDFRQVGSETLNFEFAWKPLISDLLSFSNSVRRSKEIVDRFVEEAGRKLHRKYRFPSTTTVTTQVSVGSAFVPAPALPAAFYSSTSNSTMTVTTTTKVEQWFSGCFRYHLPITDSMIDKVHLAASKADKLYGVKLTPEVVWNLAPWSWAADWFSNMGDMVSNVSSIGKDGLVLQYGYMMETVTITKSYHQFGTVYFDGSVSDLTQNFTQVRKQRIKATPYGFGLNLDAFTARQWAIIAALGISRKPRAL